MTANYSSSKSGMSSSTSQSECPCFICDEKPEDIKKLKTHLLLKHSKMNLCLFCVENKGWSDNFASQSSYNEHYWVQHEGVIESKAKRRDEIRNERKVEQKKWKEERKTAIKLGLPLPKKPKRKFVCSLCTRKAVEVDGPEYDRHLISEHGFDYCKLCHLMGQRLSIRLHIAKKHSETLCYVCCSSSPKFATLEAVRHHMLNKHQPLLKSDIGINPFPCYDCQFRNTQDEDNKVDKDDTNKLSRSYSSPQDYVTHLINDHKTGIEEPLQGMNRKRLANKLSNSVADVATEINTAEDTVSRLNLISGITNETGQDCFSISVLHLLAQTELITPTLPICNESHIFHENAKSPSDTSSTVNSVVLSLDSHCLEQDLKPQNSSRSTRCRNASCLLAHFLRCYNPKQEKEGLSTKKKRLTISPRIITQNYLSFGIDTSGSIPIDCGDFLRACLKQISNRTSKLNQRLSASMNLENGEKVNHESSKSSQIDRNETSTNNTEGMDIKSLFHVSIEWKFECQSCHRYLVTSMKDYVLKIDGSKEASLDTLLQRFLHRKICRCGIECKVEPLVKHHGKYIFVEIDRSIDYNEDNDASNVSSTKCITEEGDESSSKELSLYSLRLEESYNIFGCKYTLFGTVNYNLELDEGGHYITNLFPSQDECIRIHETDVKSVRRKPDFDVDTVIIALRRADVDTQQTKEKGLALDTESNVKSGQEEITKEIQEEENLTMKNKCNHRSYEKNST